MVTAQRFFTAMQIISMTYKFACGTSDSVVSYIKS